MAKKEISGIKSFFYSLDSARKDAFISLINRYSMSLPEVVMVEKKTRLQEIVKQINDINKKRESLTRDAELLEDFIERIDFFTKNNESVSLEMVLTRNMFYRQSLGLREKALEMRPSVLLEEKSKLTTELQLIDDMRNCYAKINFILYLIKKKNGVIIDKSKVEAISHE